MKTTRLLALLAVASTPFVAVMTPTASSASASESARPVTPPKAPVQVETPASEAEPSTEPNDELPGAKAPRLPLQPYEKLITFLPAIPAHWKAEKANGSLTDTEELHLSTAERTYYLEPKNDKDDAPIPSATVTIIDSSSNSELFDSDDAVWDNLTKTEDGYDRRLTIDGMRAVEHYNSASKTGSLSVFVAQRYFVQIELTNLDPKELTSWLKKVDISALSQLN